MQRSASISDPKPWKSKKRCFAKCEECRREKKRCTPEDRKWNDDVKEKCARCEKRGHTCGPNTKVSRTYQEPSSCPMEFSHSEMSIDFMEENVLPDLIFTESTNSGSNSATSTPRSSFRTPAFLPLRSLRSSGDLRIAPYRAKQEPHKSVGGDECVSLAQYTRKSLSEAGTLLEIHKVLQGRITAVVTANDRVGPLNGFRDMEHALYAYESATKQEAYGKMRSALAVARQSDLATLEKENLLSSLDYLARRLLQTLDESESEWSNETMFCKDLRSLQALTVEELSSLHEKQGNLFEASNLRRSYQSLMNAKSPATTVEICEEKERAAFEDACTRMWKTLTGLKFVYGKYERLLLGAAGASYKGNILWGKLPPTHLALLEGKILSEEICYQAASDTLETDLLGRTVLHLAAELGSLEQLVNVCLSRGFNPVPVAKGDIFSLTPLAILALQGDLKNFKFLVKNGADLKVRDMASRNLLAIACRAGSVPVVDYLLGLHIPTKDPTGMCSPLHEALSGGHEKIAKLLVDQPNILQWSQKPASALAFGQGFEELGRRLRNLELQQQARSIQLKLQAIESSRQNCSDDQTVEGMSTSDPWMVILRDSSNVDAWTVPEDDLSSCTSCKSSLTVSRRDYEPETPSFIHEMLRPSTRKTLRKEENLKKVCEEDFSETSESNPFSTLDPPTKATSPFKNLMSQTEDDFNVSPYYEYMNDVEVLTPDQSYPVYDTTVSMSFSAW